MTIIIYPREDKLDRIQDKHFSSFSHAQIKQLMMTVVKNRELSGQSNHSDFDYLEAPYVFWATLNGKQYGVTVSSSHAKKGIIKFISVYPIWKSKREYMMKEYNMKVVKK